jgi:AraC-like DNA-binding protein
MRFPDEPIVVTRRLRLRMSNCWRGRTVRHTGAGMGFPERPFHPTHDTSATLLMRYRPSLAGVTSYAGLGKRGTGPVTNPASRGSVCASGAPDGKGLHQTTRLQRHEWPRTARSEPTRQRALSATLTVLVDPDTSVPLFWSCAQAFRTISSVPHRALRVAARVAYTDIQASIHALNQIDTVSAQVVRDITSASSNAGALREQVVAQRIAKHASSVGRSLKRSTGLSYRQWTWAVRLKITVQELANTPKPIKAIAYESGFSDPCGHTTGATQLDRCFARVFGMTPGAFRAFARTAPVTDPPVEMGATPSAKLSAALCAIANAAV